MIDLDALDALHAAATPGEWQAVMNHCYCEIRVEDGQIGDMCASTCWSENNDNLELYARFNERSIRTVLGCKGGDINYRYDREMNGFRDPYKGRSESCWITTWRDWCRGAEVLHVAE